MPHGGIVDLIGLQVVHTPRGLRVVLLFADWANRRHSATFRPTRFLEALNQIANPNAETRVEGLKMLGVYAEDRPGGPFYRLRLSGDFVASLGDLAGGSGNDLLLMLHERSPRPDMIRAAIREGRELNMPNPSRH